MNTFIVDKDILKAASMLDPKRKFSSIYEGIHGLASLLGVSRKLVTPKKSKPNHPCALQYVDYEKYWWYVLSTYYDHWFATNARKETSYTGTICYKNLEMLGVLLGGREVVPPPFISDEFITIHRSVLFQKLPEYYGEFGWGSLPKKEMAYFIS